MKTLVVLCSLVSIALAAPALQEEGIEVTDHAQDWNIQVRPSILEPVKREKKSPLDQSANPLWHTDTSNTEIHIDSEVPAQTARSFGLKKPLIVKKKFGYRLYRDSDEEKANADSHESCGRQVKVKLCDEDGKFRDMLRSTGHEISEIHTSEDDMKNSIMMAKEAVENLQRDLKKMEQKSDAMKTAHESDTDAALHEDIEVARQALEHIHKNFGNLDTTNVHTTASRDSEALHDLHVTVARSEEEKMAQWKEAMDTIQKNIEIARNIEDSFKVADDKSLLQLDLSQSPSTINEHRMEETEASTLGENHMRGVETTDLLTQTSAQENHEMQLPHEAVIEPLREHHAREDQHIEDDMRPSASEALEMKTVNIENHHTFRSDNHKRHEHEQHAEAKSVEHVTQVHNKAIENTEKTEEHIHLPKSSETEVNVVSPTDSTKHLQTLIRETDEQIGSKLDTKKDVLFKTSENIEDNSMAPSMDAINTLISGVLSEQHQRNTDLTDLDDKTEHHLKHEKVLGAKTVEHDETKEKIKEETKLRDVIEKSDEQSNIHLEDFGTISTDASDSLLRESEGRVLKDHLANPTHEVHMQSLHKFDEHNENFIKAAHPLNRPAIPAFDSLRVQNRHHNIDYNESEEISTKVPEMKAADNHLLHPLTTLKSADGHMHHHLTTMKASENHLHHLESEPVHSHWAHESRHLAAMKAAEGFRKEIHGIDHKGNSHLADHHFGPNKMGVNQDFEISEHGHKHSHFPSRYHHNMMSHSQMHDTNNIPGGAMSSNFHTNMRDAMEGMESEHMFRWKPSHETSRNAYGASISGSIGSIGSSGGAVGVFPTANTGGCGIPLLLSCSPSVVSGSLAKAHVAGPAPYVAPSYRTEEDFSFHNKRDIKKTNEIRSTNILRTPAIVKQKSSTVLENNI